jgi:hypothetical protein
MEFKWKLGASAAAAALLTACGPAAEETPEAGIADAAAPEGGEVAAADATEGHDMAAMETAQVGAEGGEGEAGATAQLDPQAKAVASLLLIRGHTMAGDALYAAGETEMAKPHLSHPKVELYSAEMESLRQYGAEAAAQAGDRIVALGEANAPAEEVSAAVDETFTAIDASIGNVGASLGQRAEAISAVLEGVRVEYNVSVTDGAVTNAAEYQDAWGFIQAVREVFDSWRGEFDAADAEAASAFSDRLAELEALHADPVPSDSPPAVEDFRTAVTQAQLALVPFQQS